jgi:hypothetical protein
VAEDSQINAQHSGQTEPPEGAMVLNNGAFIETLFDKATGEPYYRTCCKGGSLCRYSADLWQAQIYAEYY